MKSIVTSPLGRLLSLRRRNLGRAPRRRSTSSHGVVGKMAEDLLYSSDPIARRRALSKAITLTESTVANDEASWLLDYIQKQQTGSLDTFRVGLAGAPGAGKSTFIEALGHYILEITSSQNASSDDDSMWTPEQLAVLCVDPSSSVAGGSILGDKTRMPELSRHPRAYVRPSASRGRLGGLAAHTPEGVTLAHAAGYPLVLVETVGVGQSELEVERAVDLLLVLVPPGNGDDLQGIKKGILEVADAILVTKADGSLETVARATAADYSRAMQFQSRKQGGPFQCPPVWLCSSFSNKGIPEVWDNICKFRSFVVNSGIMEERRADQAKYWMWKNLLDCIEKRTREDSRLKKRASELEEKLLNFSITPRGAANDLLDAIGVISSDNGDSPTTKIRK